MRSFNSIAIKLAMLAQYMTKQEFTEVLISKSNNFKQYLDTLPKPEPKPVMSDKVAAIHTAIKCGDFGCRTESVRALMQVVTGLDIPTFEEKRNISIDYNGLAVVMPMNPDKHGTFVNNPVLILNGTDELVNEKFELVRAYGPAYAGDLQAFTEESVISEFASKLYDEIKAADVLHEMHKDLIKTLDHLKNLSSGELCCAESAPGPSGPISLKG